MSTIEALQLNVAIFTGTFQVRGTIHVLGMLFTFVNDDQKSTFVVYNAEVVGVDATNPVRMNQPEMIVNKRDSGLVLFETTPPQSSISLPPRAAPLVAYPERFAASA